MPSLESTRIPDHHRGFAGPLLLGLILFGITLAVFSSACENNFLVWDDDVYVHNEPHVFTGISPNNLYWDLTAHVSNNWHPITLMSLQLDAQLFGPDPRGFHRTAVILHAINAMLAFHALNLLTRSPLKSGLVALLFAIHPLRVESVAWISERKDLLSGMFFLLTLISYAWYSQRQSLARFLFVILFLALGLCSKSMLVTTPCVLLLLDYWPLNRITSFHSANFPRIRTLLIEKLPLFGLSGVVACLTILFQKGSMSDLEKLPLACRIENSLRGTTEYLFQTFWPIGFSPLYPIPELSIVRDIVAIVILLGMTLVAIWQWQHRPFLIVGWFWFLGMLVPVSGLIQVGMQQRADRYTYLPHIGFFLALVWSVSDVVTASRLRIVFASLVTPTIAAGLICVTIDQIHFWHDDKTLWTKAYTENPRNRAAICYLIPQLFLEGDRQKAAQLGNEAIAINDRFHREGLVTLGNILAGNGEFEVAVRAMDQAIELRPDSMLFAGRGGSFAALGKWDNAIDSFRRAIELSPENLVFQFCLSNALAKNGQDSEANQVRMKALRQNPKWPETAAAIAWETSTKDEKNQQFLFLALCLAEEANVLTGGNQSRYLDVLAAAQAAFGQFDVAASTAIRAMQRAEIEGQFDHSKAIWLRLELYRNQKHFCQISKSKNGDAQSSKNSL